MGAARAYTNGRQRMEVSGAIDVTVRLLAVAASFPLLTAGFGVVGRAAATLAAALVGVLLYSSLLWRWRTAAAMAVGTRLPGESTWPNPTLLP